MARSPCSVLRGARHPQRVTCSHVAVDFEGLRPRGLHLEDAAALLPGQEELLAVLWELCRKKEKVSEKTSPCPLSPSCCQHDPSRRSPRQEPTSCAHLRLWCWMCAGAGGPWVPSISTPVTQYLPIYPNAAIWAPIQGRSWASGQAAAAQGWGARLPGEGRHRGTSSSLQGLRWGNHKATTCEGKASPSQPHTGAPQGLWGGKKVQKVPNTHPSQACCCCWPAGSPQCPETR